MIRNRNKWCSYVTGDRNVVLVNAVSYILVLTLSYQRDPTAR